MKFSCDRCRQRYVTRDEPQPGYSYRILCLACGGTVLLKGSEFPALPTFVADPAARGQARPEADAEEPVALALAPMEQQEPRAAERTQPPQMGVPRREARVWRWGQFAAASGVALATIGAGVLLLSGRPTPEPGGYAAMPRGTSATMGLLAGKTSVPDSASPANSPATPPPDPSAALAPAGGEGPPRPAIATRTSSATGFAPGEVTAPSPGGAMPSARPMAAAPPMPAPLVVGKAPGGPRPAAVDPESPTAPRPSAPLAPSGHAAHPTPDDVAAAVAAKQPAFDACLQESMRNEPGSLVGGLRVTLVLTVDSSGIATSPQLGDPELQDSVLGGCLRNVARQILLPPFAGERFQVRIPLKLGE